MMNAYRKKVYTWDLIPGNHIQDIVVDMKTGTISLIFPNFWCELESTDPHLYSYFYYIGDNLAEPEEVDHIKLVGKKIVHIVAPFLANDFEVDLAVTTLYFEDGTGIHIGSERRSVPLRFT